MECTQRSSQPGPVSGRILRQQKLGDLLVTETLNVPREQVPTHAHLWANFCFVVRGGFDEITGFDSHSCSVGACLYRPMGHVHGNRFGPAGGICLGLELEKSPSLQAPTTLQSKTLSREAGLLRQELGAGTSGTLIAESLAAILLGKLECLSLNPESRAPKWLVEVRDKLTEEFKENHSLSELTVLANVHPMHLSREFHRFFGCSTGEYVRIQRLQFAHRLLTHSTVPIAVIAHEAGFADQAHMARLFKRSFGITPLQARQRR